MFIWWLLEFRNSALKISRDITVFAVEPGNLKIDERFAGEDFYVYVSQMSLKICKNKSEHYSVYNKDNKKIL